MTPRPGRLPRQVATPVEDLPHEFEAMPHYTGACALCGATRTDARHEAWERVELASRQSAASNRFPREFGS